jgi:cytochrome c-type biogenesis protein
LLGSLLFVLGFSLVFVSYGAVFGGLGNQLSANEELISRILGVLTIFLGFIFYGRFPFSPTIRPKMRTTGGLLGAPMLGVLFGIGWTPCIGPALAAVQTLAFQESSAVRGAILSFGYCLGLGLPFILSGLSLDKSAKLRSLIYRRGDVISKVGGIFLITIGLLQVLGFWSQIMKILQSIIFGAFIGFCATMLHNIYNPYGFLASLLLTFLSIKAVGQTFFYVRYQLFAAISWLAVVVRAGSLGAGNELLIYGNTYGNLFLIGGFIVLILGLILKKSNFR